MAFRANDLNLSALLDGGSRKGAYILSLIRRYHPRYRLNDMTLDLELVIIRITFLFVSFDTSKNGVTYMTDPSLFSRRQDFSTIWIYTR
jgi:hypothetical protein